MIYLNNAATSWPKPEEVYAAVDAFTRRPAADFGRGNDAAARRCSEVIYECRCVIAALLGIARPDRVVFTCNATDAINVALKGILRKGDHVIISDMEHNAVLRPVEKMRSAGLIELSVAQSDEHGVLSPSAIASEIRPNTALVEIIHMSNVTGSVNDIASIGDVCARANVPLMVDASQSAGSIDIDAAREGVSLLAAPGHKGLLGPQGTGILYVAPGIELGTLREGGTGSDSLSLEQPFRLPDRLESGTLNPPGIAGLLEGVRFLARRGVAAVGAHKRRLVQALRERLADVDGLTEYSSGRGNSTIFAFVIAGRDSSELCEHLAEYDIAVRGGFQCAPSAHRKFQTIKTGMVRVSPGVFSTDDDMVACADAVRRYVRSLQ